MRDPYFKKKKLLVIILFQTLKVNFSSANTSIMDQPTFKYERESEGDRLLRKSQEAPMFPIAVGVLTAAVAYGAYMFKNKGKMSTSVYLMHLRVGAQGAAVGALTLGLLYTMVKQHLLKKE